jgi:hypothetical protein
VKKNTRERIAFQVEIEKWKVEQFALTSTRTQQRSMFVYVLCNHGCCCCYYIKGEAIEALVSFILPFFLKKNVETENRKHKFQNCFSFVLCSAAAENLRASSLINRSSPLLVSGLEFVLIERCPSGSIHRDLSFQLLCSVQSSSGAELSKPNSRGCS